MPKKDLMEMVLEYDPTQDACLETGRDMSDPNTAELALTKMREDAFLKQRILENRHDTHRSMHYREYVKTAEDIGFTIIYEITLKRSNKDRFIVMWHDAGLLLRLDTCNQKINRCFLYFNWQGNTRGTKLSGRFLGQKLKETSIWVGRYSVDIGLRYHVSLLYKRGRPLHKWVENPDLRLTNWQECQNLEDKSPEEITLMRIERFPEKVKEAIGF